MQPLTHNGQIRSDALGSSPHTTNAFWEEATKSNIHTVNAVCDENGMADIQA